MALRHPPVRYAVPRGDVSAVINYLRHSWPAHSWGTNHDPETGVIWFISLSDRDLSTDLDQLLGTGTATPLD